MLPVYSFFFFFFNFEKGLWGGYFYCSHILQKRRTSLKMVKRLSPKITNRQSVWGWVKLWRAKSRAHLTRHPIAWFQREHGWAPFWFPFCALWNDCAQRCCTSFLHVEIFLGSHLLGRRAWLAHAIKQKWRVSCLSQVGWEAGVPSPCCFSSLPVLKAPSGKCALTPWSSH